ncbi:iron uptake transporter deferrochelatase/peroxidase subunit [Rhodococcus sp. X156]|uniref:iron uptake transporter deferrochelatase/peroxidase subunit n=1 Tax=Rhodococcus sp. X156 TaxID=2499145 RepID=UPI000FDB3742|nr:iron uptake transporter deferrochelatase/peroxidase subunit [Rhodococcus sp. X156]
MSTPSPGGRFSRRRLLGLGGAAVAAAGVGVGVVAGRETAGGATVPGSATVAFRGSRQAGIITPAQDRLHFVAFDVTTDSRTELVDLLREWTQAAERMTAGQEAVPDGATGGKAHAPPGDTGEALGLPASSLTLTIGFGPSLFTHPAQGDRFGIAGQRPDPLTELPRFPHDQLDPARSGGDLAIQACADDPQVAVHAIRNLARIGFGVVSVRWSQLGFGRTSSTSTTQATPRNLFGFKDGTRNLKAEDPVALDQHVWVQPGDGPAWLSGGTYLVARRIRMQIETWDRSSLKEQETIVGRTKGSGAPLGQVDEFDPVDLGIRDSRGPVIPVDSHVRLASAEELGGIQLLRRGYNFTDGSDGVGHLDAGLFFLACCRNPQTQFVPMQLALASRDAMTEYLEHNGSAVFACPPGLGSTDYWGSTLFG